MESTRLKAANGKFLKSELLEKYIFQAMGSPFLNFWQIPVSCKVPHEEKIDHYQKFQTDILNSFIAQQRPPNY